jgi:hypothetical protein
VTWILLASCVVMLTGWEYRPPPSKRWRDRSPTEGKLDRGSVQVVARRWLLSILSRSQRTSATRCIGCAISQRIRGGLCLRQRTSYTNSNPVVESHERRARFQNILRQTIRRLPNLATILTWERAVRADIHFSSRSTSSQFVRRASPLPQRGAPRLVSYHQSDNISHEAHSGKFPDTIPLGLSRRMAAGLSCGYGFPEKLPFDVRYSASFLQFHGIGISAAIAWPGASAEGGPATPSRGCTPCAKKTDDPSCPGCGSVRGSSGRRQP